MAQIVPADFRELRTLDRLLEAAASDVAMVERSGGLRDENDVGRFT
jgi:hypothetical protein